ncbi:PREDICTED: uncharacterized protein LOC104720624 [Camelina sativa]|uniref:Uncharacterized protein LOC104720624 n=1 Tax=Camelina sativa TaxID=90675 RepID=A0ABM0U6T0_CAMSA|nr:PREDICTED: uncharacterized protein LOC104720624 [Camelina sativa]
MEEHLLWKGPLKVKPGKMIGSGVSTPVWGTPWISLDHPIAPMGPPTKENQYWRVENLFLPDSKEWNLPLIRQTLPYYEECITQLRPNKQGGPDSWAWLPTPDGVYTAKSGYHEALRSKTTRMDKTPSSETVEPVETFLWKKEIWNIKCSPKTKLLLWKAAQKAIPVGSNLQLRQLDSDPRCPHCGILETEAHLFFQCPYATAVWNLAPHKEKFNLEEITNFKSGLSQTTKLTCLPPTGLMIGPLAPWIIWTLWTTRNKLIFDKVKAPAKDTLDLEIIQANEWQDAQQAQDSSPPTQTRASTLGTRSTITTTSHIVCSSDAAWRDNGNTGCAWIFKDYADQQLTQGASTAQNIRSPLMAEALATFKALEVAIESGFNQVHFASDSQLLVKALNQKSSPKELHGILYDSQSLISQFHLCTFNFIPRNCNRQADALAKNALRTLCIEP